MPAADAAPYALQQQMQPPITNWRLLHRRRRLRRRLRHRRRLQRPTLLFDVCGDRSKRTTVLVHGIHHMLWLLEARTRTRRHARPRSPHVQSHVTADERERERGLILVLVQNHNI
jgi:hypothetical protein